MTNKPAEISESVARVLRIGEDVNSDKIQADQNAIKMQWRIQGIKLFKAKLY